MSGILSQLDQVLADRKSQSPRSLTSRVFITKVWIKF